LGKRCTRGVALAALLSLAACSWFGGRGGQAFVVRANPQRNVLLVTIDTLRADALGQQRDRPVTPNLDRLAAHGATFTFAHAHAVVTLVSHASILTGTYPYEHGIRDNTGYRLDARQPTAGALLKARGFATGAFVGGFPLDRRFGLTPGFDRYDDRMTRTTPGGEVTDRERPADAVVRSALEWIEAQPAKWFAWVHVYDPHEPYQPPGAFASRFASEPYLGEVAWTDESLGLLFAKLRQHSRPTLVVVTGDHGESLGEHGERTHSLFAYESTLHVPLIISEIDPASGAEMRPRVIDAPARHVDILPTILASTGAALPPVSGVSLLDTIAAGAGPERPSYFEAMSAAVTRGWAPLRGILVGREKYIDLPIVELYDVAADPAEGTNLARTRPDRLRVLTETLKQFNVAPPQRARPETADTIERLRSLGYIGGGSAAIRDRYTDADDPKRLVEIEQLLTKGNDALRANRNEEAIAIFKAIVVRRPDTEDAYRKLALAYWRTNRPRLAIETLEAALRNGVTQSEVRIRLAEYLTGAGQAAKAVALLEKDAGDDPDALLVLGNALTESGRNADAMAAYTRLLALDPANALAHENLGTARLQARDYTGAEAELRTAIRLDPSLAAAHTALGVLLASTGRKPEAITEWTRAAALGDRNAADNLRAIRD
jgi:arylsulfatase A-like enzyme/Tfp pilus assembly protein PilF